MHGRNGLQFDMQMYPDCIFNCLHFGHGLLIFLILMVFWLSETSQICSLGAFSWDYIGGIDSTNLVISEEMEKTTLSILKLSSGVYPLLLCNQTFLFSTNICISPVRVRSFVHYEQTEGVKFQIKLDIIGHATYHYNAFSLVHRTD